MATVKSNGKVLKQIPLKGNVAEATGLLAAKLKNILLVLLIAIVIALVAIALLGFFPGLAGDAKKTQSDSYWKSARPFGVLEHTQAGTNLTLVLANNEPAQLNVTAIYSGEGSNFSSFLLNAGEKKVVIISNATSCTAGSAYEYPMNITYNSNDLTAQKQLGTKPLIGKCT